MVTFKNMGRLGNFLFECATSWAYAKEHGLEFTVPLWTNDQKWNPLYLPHLRNPVFNPRQPQMIIREQGHEYQELPFREDWRNKNIILEGYWQSEKYFKKYRKELLKAFALPWTPVNEVSIHVRRGDYLLYPDKHPVVPDQYYLDAIKVFVLLGYRKFNVFSDDMPWCINYFTSLKMVMLDVEFDFSFSLGPGGELGDLIEISNCAAGHINSSSTFSWWSSWLNQNPTKRIITPRLWFVEGHGGLNTNDIIPETWTRL